MAHGITIDFYIPSGVTSLRLSLFICEINESYYINPNIFQQKWLIILRAMIANDREKMVFLFFHLNFGVIRIKPDLC